MNREAILKWLKRTDIPLTTISKKTNISRKTLYNWINGNEVRERSLNKLVNIYEADIQLTNNEISIKKENNVEAQYIIDLQKEKIERLEADVKRHQLNPVQSTHWDILEYDFLVKVELSFKGFKMGRKIVEVEGMNILCQILGYSKKEMTDLWDIGVHYNDFDNHPIDTILTKESIDILDKKNKTLPMVFNQLKDMVGNHYIPIPVSYKAKDNTIIHTISYNKVNWVKKYVESKVQVLNS